MTSPSTDTDRPFAVGQTVSIPTPLRGSASSTCLPFAFVDFDELRIEGVVVAVAQVESTVAVQEGGVSRLALVRNTHIEPVQ